MTNFSNGKITTSVIFFRNGIPNSDKNFGAYVSLNYEMLRQISRYNRNRLGRGRQMYKFF